MKKSPFKGRKVKILLLKPLSGKGNAGEIVEVKTHFALHVLVPQGIAVVYDKQVENQRSAQEKKIVSAKKDQQEAVKKFVSQIEADGGIYFEKQATETNKLYDSITAKNLINYILMNYKVNLQSENISLENKIEELGEYTAEFSFEDITTSLPISVVKKAD